MFGVDFAGEPGLLPRVMVGVAVADAIAASVGGLVALDAAHQLRGRYTSSVVRLVGRVLRDAGEPRADEEPADTDGKVVMSRLEELKSALGVVPRDVV